MHGESLQLIFPISVVKNEERVVVGAWILGDRFTGRMCELIASPHHKVVESLVSVEVSCGREPRLGLFGSCGRVFVG